MNFPSLKCLAAAALLMASSCAMPPPAPDAFKFAVTGDTPYSAAEERRMVDMIADLNALDLAFVVHVGDIKAGSNSPCTDELFMRRKAQFEQSRNPFVLTPGDNDWTDCRRASNGKYDPLERLAALRRIFYAPRLTMGARELPGVANVTECKPGFGAEPPCTTPYPENLWWERGGVLFVTLNIPGSNNNVGFDAASDGEAVLRGKANAELLDAAIARVRESKLAGLAVFIQANVWEGGKERPFDAFVAQFARGAEALQKPVLFVHGDTHLYRVNRPFRNAAGKTIENLTRLETFGSPTVGWVRISVDRNDPAVFRIEPGATYP